MISPVAVSVHAAALDVDDSVLGRLRATLSSEERRRADALSGALERRWFVADHGLRRRLLGRALGIEPAAIAYVVDPGGKPCLAGPGRPWFSASRAGDIALYAVCETAEVGVDVEAVRGDEDERALVDRLMSVPERAAWGALSPAERPTALTACWVRKEAHGKALGHGLVFPLSRVQAWAGDDRPVRCGDIEIRGVDLLAAGLDAARAGELAAAVAVRAAPGESVRVHAEPLAFTVE